MRSFYTIYRCSWTFYDVLHLSTCAPDVHMTLQWAFSSYRDWVLSASHSTSLTLMTPLTSTSLSHRLKQTRFTREYQSWLLVHQNQHSQHVPYQHFAIFSQWIPSLPWPLSSLTVLELPLPITLSFPCSSLALPSLAWTLRHTLVIVFVEVLPLLLLDILIMKFSSWAAGVVMLTSCTLTFLVTAFFTFHLTSIWPLLLLFFPSLCLSHSHLAWLELGPFPISGSGAVQESFWQPKYFLIPITPWFIYPLLFESKGIDPLLCYLSPICSLRVKCKKTGQCEIPMISRIGIRISDN